MNKNLKPSNSLYGSRLGIAASAFVAMLIAGLASQAHAAEETKDTRDNRTPASQAKEDLRYAGRTFDDWRQQLLNDLDPKTCAAAMEPIAAFGKMGYADEAVAALGALLRTDRAAVDDSLASQAAGTLARIGPLAIPVLTEGLDDPRPTIRQWCAYGLGELGVDAHSAKEPLLKLLADKQHVQIAALRSLIQVAGDDDDLQPVFGRLAHSDDQQIRLSFASALSAYPPKGGWWVPLFVQLADDETSDVRKLVGTLLARRGPPQKEVIAAVEQLICDDDFQVSSQTTVSITQGSNTALLLAVLADAFESPELWSHFRQGGQLRFAAATLSKAPDLAKSSVPLLAAILSGKAPSFDEQDELAAIDALGALGAAGHEAIPALERRIAELPLADSDVRSNDDDTCRKHARRALKKIRGD